MKNINPKKWGPQTWSMLYYIVSAYPVKPTTIDKQSMSAFVNSLSLVLPCSKCRVNFLSHIGGEVNSHAIYLKSRKDLSAWLYNLHESISYDNMKHKLTYAQFKLKYSRCKSNKKEYIHSACYGGCIGVILALVLCVLLLI